METYNRYDKYTLLNTSLEKIYQKRANTEFQKLGIRPLYPIRKSTRTNKSKYCRFHRGHDHSTIDCIRLKDVIEALTKRGRLSKYVKGGK